MKHGGTATKQTDLIKSGVRAANPARTQMDIHTKEEDVTKIFIKTVEGKSVCWRIWDRRKIQELKHRIQNQLGILAHLQNLICSGNSLQDNLTLKDYGINTDATITINL